MNRYDILLGKEPPPLPVKEWPTMGTATATYCDSGPAVLDPEVIRKLQQQLVNPRSQILIRPPMERQIGMSEQLERQRRQFDMERMRREIESQQVQFRMWAEATDRPLIFFEREL